MYFSFAEVTVEEICEIECYIHSCNKLLQMFIEQNKLKRQSHLLLQNSVPDQQLLKALDENAKLTQLLEEERIQHQQKVSPFLLEF